MRRLLLVLGLAVVSLGAAGCNEFHYHDIFVRYDSSMFFGATLSTEVSRVRTCHVYVTGADTQDFYIGGKCTNGNSTDLGIFEFSTFADSGTLNFTIKTYVGNEFEMCLLGTGTKSVQATSAVTTSDDPSSQADDLVIGMRNANVSTTCPP
jgi:hypothetical protein